MSTSKLAAVGACVPWRARSQCDDTCVLKTATPRRGVLRVRDDADLAKCANIVGAVGGGGCGGREANPYTREGRGPGADPKILASRVAWGPLSSTSVKRRGCLVVRRLFRRPSPTCQSAFILACSDILLARSGLRLYRICTGLSTYRRLHHDPCGFPHSHIFLLTTANHLTYYQVEASDNRPPTTTPTEHHNDHLH